MSNKIRENKKYLFITDDSLSEDRYKKERNKLSLIKKKNWWKNKISKGICFYCNKSFNKNELTIDHKIPISKGGRSVKGNLVPCCKECNNNKKSDIVVELKIEELDII